ncbi:hypothetical protein A3Q56_05375 [Intoshia linei]|uniref:C-type lectin domain-containing protein n=1 Tax=Intoshia linei TaxID=1819745 RepID=A0A177AY31_9BILA|nr:hypothetical protein A3Q56_05375 [Intoshia linei]
MKINEYCGMKPDKVSYTDQQTKNILNLNGNELKINRKYHTVQFESHKLPLYRQFKNDNLKLYYSLNQMTTSKIDIDEFKSKSNYNREIRFNKHFAQPNDIHFPVIPNVCNTCSLSNFSVDKKNNLHLHYAVIIAVSLLFSILSVLIAFLCLENQFKNKQEQLFISLSTLEMNNRHLTVKLNRIKDALPFCLPFNQTHSRDTELSKISKESIQKLLYSFPLIYEEKKDWIVYNKSKYKILNQSFSAFTMAQKNCAVENGHLIHIDDIYEEIFVRILQLKFTNINSKSYNVWLGAKNFGPIYKNFTKQAHFHWVDSYGNAVSKVKHFNDMIVSHSHQCLVISLKEWKSIPCTSTKSFKAICEVDLL